MPPSIAGYAAAVFTQQGTVVTATNQPPTISGGGADTIWANSTSLVYNASNGFNSQAAANFTFDDGSSNSTVVSGTGAVNGRGAGFLPQPTMFVDNGGVLNVQGNSQATLVAGAGNNTINAAAANGAQVLLASTGNSSLLGGNGNDYFVAGSGNATMVGGTAIDGLVVIAGSPGGADLLINWTTADPIFLFGYGGNGIASQQVVGGSLQLTLSDQKQITLAGITSIGSAQFQVG